MNEQITGALFKQMVLHGAAIITSQKQSINDLNVFPVPDGDTGTNMSMTIGAAVTELRKSTPTTLTSAADLTASALLRGARGNSGVILSLLFRGLSKGLKGRESASAAEFAAAMQEGVSAAYKAVMKPAEGTVLTVSRLASKRAVDVASAGETDAQAVLAEAIREGYEALAQTTDMNPVLKKAGVVDAGGKGYLLILEGMLAALRGEPLPEPEEASQSQEKADFAALSEEEITFTFDTVFIVRKTTSKSLESLRAYLSSIGDSLVIGEDDEAFKVHVHTDIPGEALSESQKYGTLELAKIENMRTQAQDLAAGRTAQSTDDLDMVEAELESAPAEEGHVVAAPEKKYGFLAVCAGDGLASVFQDLGADGVVSGGQTMNPSTESLLAGVDKIPAETVFILPNNSNIIMAAQQCSALTEKNVVVIPTKTVPQGITAMMNADFDAADAQDITDAMTQSLSTVTTAQITYAARNSDFDGFDIKEGDYLALEEGKLFGTDSSLDALLEKLAADAVERGATFISLYFGEDVSEADASRAGSFFSSACPDAEVAIIPGGQPVYYYIISME